MKEIEIALKPVLLRGPLFVRVDRAGISTRDDNKTNRMDFSTVREVFVSATGSHGLSARAVEFVDSGNNRLHFSTTNLAETLSDKKYRRNFDRVAAAALLAFANARPGATVGRGAGRRSNTRTMMITSLMMFVIWLFQVLPDQRIEPVEYALLAMMAAIVAWMARTQFNVVEDPPQQLASGVAAEFARSAEA